MKDNDYFNCGNLTCRAFSRQINHDYCPKCKKIICQVIETKEDICRKIRATIEEFGKEEFVSAIIVGPYNLGNHVSDVGYYQCPTISEVTLGNVHWEVARFFEDI